jgi:sulfate/thiosulfate transport system substrate-binding protein
LTSLNTTTTTRRHRAIAASSLMAVAIGLLPTGVAAQDPAASFEAAPGAVTLAAYTTPREVYEEVIPLFLATEAGGGLRFEQSYSGSGDQSRAVEAGLPADLVALSLWPDVERLVEPGIVAEDWDEGEHGGIVSNSVVVLAYRPGNPKGITGWDDLARDDVSVITPNPFTSGGAQWNLLAAYQAQIVAGSSEEEAREFLRRVISRTTVMDRSAREALATFAAGQGDVLIAYENEAIFAQQAGQPLEYIVPAATILIENPIAVTLTGDALGPAQAFVDFLYTPEVQTIFGAHGYRPEVEEVLDTFDFPQPTNLFTIEDLGGWVEARPRFFDPETGLVAQIFGELGRETA